MNSSNPSPSAIAETLGVRLKQARLNENLTQIELADRAGVSRKAVLNAEKGQAQLEVFVALLLGLNLGEQLNLFLPAQPISPVQLAKLQSKQRQRASRQQKSQNKRQENRKDEEVPKW